MELLFNPNHSIHITHSFAKIKWLQVLLSITNNSIKHQSFVYSELKDQTILQKEIQICINDLFGLSLKGKQSYFTHW